MRLLESSIQTPQGTKTSWWADPKWALEDTDPPQEPAARCAKVHPMFSHQQPDPSKQLRRQHMTAVKAKIQLQPGAPGRVRQLLWPCPAHALSGPYTPLQLPGVRAHPARGQARFSRAPAQGHRCPRARHGTRRWPCLKGQEPRLHIRACSRQRSRANPAAAPALPLPCPAPEELR